MIKYLALGDSYTIGEQVAYDQNFPSQLVQMLKSQGHEATLDQLIAQTGWTTDELSTAIYEKQPSFDYNLVSLLIGVNNQYRGRSVEEYACQFYGLLCQSILYASSKPHQVVVLSIPDWGLTPFNTSRDRIQVSNEIDAYNLINAKITKSLGCHYIDITASTRSHANDLSYLVADQLHYSDKEYRLWAESILNLVVKEKI